ATSPPLSTPSALPLSPARSPHLRSLPSFPTQRSSDLLRRGLRAAEHPGQALVDARRPPAGPGRPVPAHPGPAGGRRASTSAWPRSEEQRLNSSHVKSSYAVFCLKKKKKKKTASESVTE